MLVKMIVDGDFFEVKNKIVEAFPNLTQLSFDGAEQDKWVSVEEKRPPNLQPVLTCDKLGNIHIFADWVREEIPFGIAENDDRYFPPLWWHTLPEPPKGE